MASKVKWNAETLTQKDVIEKLLKYFFAIENYRLEALPVFYHFTTNCDN